MLYQEQDKFIVRVYFEDTDAGGIIYHSQYLNFAERARTEFLRQRNLEQSNLKKSFGMSFVVKKLTIDYLRFACLDDLLTVVTKVSEISKAKVVFSQNIYKNNLVITNINVTVVCLNKNGKISRMNDLIYDSLKLKES